MRALAAAAVLVATLALQGVVASEDVDAQRILFVGNSFTYVEGVDRLFVDLAASAEPPKTVEADSSVMGGATLKQHAQGSAPDDIRDGEYDVVILQGDIPENREHSIDPFLESARILGQAVADSGARTVFYMTWPFAQRPWIGLDGIAVAHRQVEAELGVPVAPAGLALANALTERPALAVIGPDGHQTLAGAYVAASVLFATVYEQSPEGLAFRPDGISADDARFLRNIAWATVQEWQSGTAVSPSTATVWVTATEICTEIDWEAAADSRTTFGAGTWYIADLPLDCLFRASDDRLSGSLRKVWNCDCSFGIGSPTWATWELSNDDGKWTGSYRGASSPSGNDRGLLVAEGSGAYEGLTFMATLDGATGVPTVEGVIIEGDPPQMPDPIEAPAE